MRVLVSGASGFIGTELREQLRAEGHTVLALVRRAPHSTDEIRWQPATGTLDPRVLDGFDAVVNLSGASVGRVPWTRRHKRRMFDSRIGSTQTLARAMAAATNPPRIFLSASATGFYGDRPAERLTEASERGDGFFAELVESWERAAELAPAGTRVVTFRTGVVIGRGGALARLVPLTQIGLGARIGTGGQHWPWISRYDEGAAIRHLLASRLSGPVNLVGPTTVTSDRVTRALARRLHRPYLLRLPEWSIRLGLGEAGRELLLSSQKVLPVRLLEDGFEFRHSTVEEAIAAAFGRRVSEGSD